MAIVDHQDLVRAAIRQILESATDFEIVAEATDSNATVRLVDRHRPDVLLMYVRAVDDGGLAAAKVVHKHWPATAVVMVTAFTVDWHVQNALRAGATAVVGTDASPRTLIDAVSAAAAGEAFLSPKILRTVLGRFTELDLDRAEHARNQLTELTDTERRVLFMLAKGFSNNRIARTCEMSEGAVKAHISRMLVKTNCENRVQLAILAYDTEYCR